MNYILIESFCALAKRLNFTKAAADIFMTQPSLSRNIVMLENELGFQLFHRSKHSVSLTELGQRFLPYAQSIKDANDRAAVFASSVAFLDLEGDPLYMDATIAWNKDTNSPPWRRKLLEKLSLFVSQYKESH